MLIVGPPFLNIRNDNKNNEFEPFSELANWQERANIIKIKLKGLYDVHYCIRPN